MNSRLFFIISSFLGQGASFGKYYLLHLATLPYLLLNWRKLGKIREYDFFFAVFIFWCALTLIWSHQMSSVKFLVILILGYLQYSFWKTVTNEEEKNRILKFLFVIACVDLLTGIVETSGLCRFPLSILNPDVTAWGKTQLINFSELSPLQVNYFRSTPTGLRWGPNNFIISSLLYLVFIERYLRQNWFWFFFSLVTFLVIAASARLIFWSYFPIFAFSYMIQRKWKSAVAALFIPVALGSLLTFNGSMIGHKARECMDFPKRLLGQLIEFEKKVIQVKSENTTTKTNVTVSPGPEVSSESSRYKFVKDSITVWMRNPVLGAGLGQSSRDPVTGKEQSPHFYFIEVLADAGVIGLLIFLAAFFFPLRRLFRIPQKERDFHLKLILIVLLGSISLSSLVYFPLYYLALGFSHWELQKPFSETTQPQEA